MVRPELPGLFGLFRGAGSSDHGRAHDVFEHLDGGGSHAGGCGENQGGFPRLEGGAAHRHIPHGQVGGGHGGGIGEGNIGGEAIGVDLGDRDEFGVAAVDSRAKEPTAAAELVASGAAPLADTATEARVDHHAVAHADGAYTGTGGNHFTRGVAAEDQRRRELALKSALALPGEDVQAVESAGTNPNDHVPRTGGGIGPVAILENLHVAVGFDIDGFHR